MVHDAARVKSIFLAAVERYSAGQWPAYLDGACGEDAELRERVECLLGAHGGQKSLHLPAPSLPDETAARPAVERPGEMVGPYKLTEQLGEGGMGVVYVAEQTRPVRRKVALKIIKPGMDTKQVIARFEAERQALAMMDHPNIAKVLDAGTTESGRPYFAMELVRGIPITEYCDREHLSISERLDLFVLVCRAVQHAHQKGIIHRDIKPSNVLITLHDGVPVPKVIDFGIAKATGQSLTDKTLYTKFAELVGTPLYMSPEQAEMSGLDVDTRSDIYSLGVLLYELVTGTTPFDQETFRTAALDEMRRIIREDEPPRPSARLSRLGDTITTISANRKADPRHLNRAVRGELDWIVMKSLEKDRRRRYETPNDFAADVMRYLTDRPVEACPPSSWYRLQKFVSRNRRGLATSVLLAVGVLTVAGVLGALSLQNAGRIRRFTQDVRQALEGARTAVEAGDLSLAGQRAAEAQGRIGADGATVPSLAREVDSVRRGVEARKADDTRFRQFLEGASDAQDRMSYDRGLGGDLVAEEALALYGVLTGNDWLSRLERSYLTAGQKQQVRETAYVTLVSLADFLVRWSGLREDPKSTERSLDLLRLAESFHPPTRAFYFVRSEARRPRGDTAAADEDVARFRAAKAQSAWDHFLPGHTAGWRGDLDEAIRSYQAALTLQPNHYNSLFFLAMRLATDKINRPAEAIAYFTGCIALRPDHIYAYTNRGELQQKLGRTEAAVADYTAAIAAAAHDLDRAAAYELRRRFFEAQGRTEEARRDLARGLELHEQWWAGHKATTGSNDAATSRVLNDLAVTYVNSGRPQDAIPLLKQGLGIAKAKFGVDASQTLSVMRNLGAAYQRVGRSQDAIPLLETTLRLREAKFRPDHPDTLTTRNSLAVAYNSAGRPTEAIRMHEATLELLEAKLGPDHPDTLTTRTNLAAAYRDAGRTTEAIRMHEPTLELLESKLGPDHRVTLAARKNLAVAYLDAGRTTEAIRMHEATLKLREAKLGPDHPDTLDTLHGLAHAMESLHPADAEPLFRRALEGYRKSERPYEQHTIELTNDLTSLLDRAGRTAEAEPIWRKSLDLLRAHPPADSSILADALAVFGLHLLTRKTWADAEPLLRECLAIREKSMPDDWRRFNAMSMLGEALLGRRQFAEAEPLLLRGYEGINQREAKIPANAKQRLAEATERIARLYEATERTEQARAWRKKLETGADLPNKPTPEKTPDPTPKTGAESK
jgi:serine/threonine protein kinase/tetratricopeptide (TPR) repeat protein